MSPESDGLDILILNPDLPVFPGRAGHEFLHTTHLTHHARTVGLVSQVHTREQLSGQSRLSDAGVRLHLWQSESASFPPQMRPAAPARSRLRHGVLKTADLAARIAHPLPRDVLIQDLQFRNISDSLLTALGERNWHAVVVVQSSCAKWVDYLPQFPVSVLVLHDVRALMLRRATRAAGNPLERFLLRLQAARARRFERKYCKKFDLVIAMSDDDERWAREHYHPQNIAAVPIPVDGDYFRPMHAIRPATSRIIFTGMMDHPPNVDAACFFARDVLPLIRREIPDAQFWIVGREPAPAVRALAATPGVVVTGFVPDIRPFIARAGVVVVPIRFGSGMRNKILEAWAMQKCVVSTHVGAEGLDYSDGGNILIADDAAALAEKTMQALREPGVADSIRRHGRGHVLEAHHPDHLSKKYFDAIAEVARKKAISRGPLRTIIDLRWMVPGEAGGMENLSRSFLNHLIRLDGFNRYTLLAPGQVKFDFDLRQRANFKILAADGPGFYLRQALQLARRLPLHWLKLDSGFSPASQRIRFAGGLNAQVALSMCGYIRPDLYPMRNVLLVHDLQHEYFPQFFSEAAREERSRVYRESIEHSTFLLTTSEYTRQTVVDKYAFPADRIRTVYQACDPIFHPENRRRSMRARVLRKYGLPDLGYLIFPANTWPHKNHPAAIGALARLRDEYGLTPLLACTGAPKNGHDSLDQLIRENRLEKQVKFLGYCPAEDLPGLYESAAAMVYPSLYEGFGIPLLEAMWCSCPIVCSNTTSLPEIAGDAALLVDPANPDAIAEALKNILTDNDLRRRLVAAGLERAKDFTWTRFATQTIEVLRNVWS
jgi:glycosyltransferase involved in cell wall biosynthesis